MKTLEQHNQQRREQERAFREIANKTGLACDKCGAEMLLRNPGLINASNPPTQSVYCPKCGHSGLMR